MRSFWLVGALTLVAAFPIASAPAAAQSEDGRDRVVQLINAAPVSLKFFYAWCSSCSPWLEDVLGPNELRPGSRVRMDLDDGMEHCFYEIEAVFADGRRQTLSRFNACENHELVLAPQ